VRRGQPRWVSGRRGNEPFLLSRVFPSTRAHLHTHTHTHTHTQKQLAEAERDLLVAQTAAETAKAEYDALVSRMEADLPRWEGERAARLSALLGAYAEEQARAAGEAARVWGALGRAPGVAGAGGV